LIYNNLISLLVVIVILSTSTIPDLPQLPPSAALAIFVLKGLFFFWAVRRVYGAGRVRQLSQYMRAEQKGTILAVACFAVDLYLLDGKYFLARLPLAERLPVVTDMGGIAIFFAYLALMWLAARRSFELVTGAPAAARDLVISNLKSNLAIILPWLFLSLLADFLRGITSPGLQAALASPLGEAGVFLVFFIILLLLFPVLMVRLWDCRPLAPGEARENIEAFCRRLGVGYREIMIWPVFGGRMLTAGVLGVVGRTRYLLVTPALLEALTVEELQAVMAHEIGHVKRYHMPLYFFLFLGFGLVAQLSALPISMVVLNSELFYRALHQFNRDPGELLALLSALPLLLLLILYFRFGFGFFMRNFERQADVYSYKAMGDISPLVRVFEKIAWLSGNIRDLPSWHHFSIGQRIDFLQGCRRDRFAARRHDLKVYAALVVYVLLLGGGSWLLWRLPEELIHPASRMKFAAAILERKISTEPENYLWPQLLADLEAQRQQCRKAVVLYERALQLAPDNAELLNNFAWLLVTAEEQACLNPKRGLELADRAVALAEQGYILDTLATAYWVNGQLEPALAMEMRAMAVDPANGDYYRQQMVKFTGGQEAGSEQ